MRSRSGSGVRLDRLMLLVEQTILKYQNPVTGLFATNEQMYSGHAWVRDNLYICHAVWGMYRAYQKSADIDEDLAKAHELGCTCVKMMQSLLECMMRQADKVEDFKKFQRKKDALHAKYSVLSKQTVVSDYGWGHLQIDATSLFLLTLAQMTASGLQIVRNFDEVAFIQNLVYYIETGFRTPDYGIWERGDKTNQGIRELNASSVGMAKAALQALNDCGDLFGDGSKGSVIHVLPDQIQQCDAVLTSMLPRESFSKETDAALLAIISYPAFAVEDQDLIQLTRDTICGSLLGRYGCRRFLRDGYKTALEDPCRLYYNNSELQQFEDIECEWPLFLCFLFLDAMYSCDDPMVEVYWRKLDEVVLADKGCRLVPEIYKVPYELVAAEKRDKGSQKREADGAIPYLWAQSLYILCNLLYDQFLTPAELDPLGRRLSAFEKRPPCEVQVTVLAETFEVQQELLQRGIEVQNVSQIDEVFCIQSASSFARLLSRVGESKKLGLTGRPIDIDVGILSTSKLYQIGQKFVIFTPQFMDRRRSHLTYDIRILMNEWSSELQYIYNVWGSTSVSGRPLVVFIVSKHMLEGETQMGQDTFVTSRHMISTVVGTIKKIATGYISGARVVMKDLSDFFRTTALTKLEFDEVILDEMINEAVESEAHGLHHNLPRIEEEESRLFDTPQQFRRANSIRNRNQQFDAVHKASMRHRSIVMDSDDADLLQLRLAYANRRELRRTSDEMRSSPKRYLSPVRSGRLANHLNNARSSLVPVSSSSSVRSLSSRDSMSRLDTEKLDEMSTKDVVSMLVETNILDEQASIVHYLWMKEGPDYVIENSDIERCSVRELVEEVYDKACECRDWGLVRLMIGLLNRQLEELGKAVTHLLVRMKQITVGMPSKNEEPITCPKTKEELNKILKRAYGDDPNSFALAQEIIVCLSSLVRTDPKLFVEMFRLRVGLIIQVLASELARLRSITGSDASDMLLHLSPFEVKSMLFSLLSGRLLEDLNEDAETGVKEQRSGISSIRKQIEERKSLRKSMHASRSPGEHRFDENLLDLTEEEKAAEEKGDSDFQFGIWLRHRRIDGALNRVPPDFYSSLWDMVRRFPRGLFINRIVLHWGVTQEMTRKEIKFALQVEQVLNQIAEPEYREMIVETLALMTRMDSILKTDRPNIPKDRPFDVDSILHRANSLFVEHNRLMGTVVMECCASGKPCDGAQGMCRHFYDSAPAGEFGTAHYLIKALMEILSPT